MPNFAIVILSCDKYADLWPGFFHQLSKTFNSEVLNAQLQKYLVTNHAGYQDANTNNLQVIRVGDDQDWSTNILIALNRIAEKKIFVILEDIFISSQIDQQDFERLIEFSIQNDVQHLKYMGYPAPTLPFDEHLGKYEAGMPYLVSVCGIWDRLYLQYLLLEGENPWEFEVNASYRAQFSAKRFYGCKKPLFEYKNMVEKGGWIPASLDWAIENGVPIKVDERSRNKRTLYHFKRLIFRLSMSLPWRFRVWLSSLFKKIIVSY